MLLRSDLATLRAPLLRTNWREPTVGRCALIAAVVGGLLLAVVVGAPPMVELQAYDAASTPPLFRIAADGPFDAGLQHGRLARSRIAGWFATAEMRKVFAFAASPNGSAALANLKADNTREFPAFAEELRGIAAGSGFDVDKIWCANLLNELGSLMGHQGFQAAPQHCSDVYAIEAGGYSRGFVHGHNDDWSSAVKPFWYFAAFTYADSVAAGGFRACAGVNYPAALVGWAPTWNEFGIYSTQNSMVPRKSRAGGLACAFVQRRAICSSSTLDEAVRALTVPGWSEGASMNVVDVRGKRMANVELWEDESSVLEVTEDVMNYTHFNQYKHLTTRKGRAVDSPAAFANDPRQARADGLPPPRTAEDVKAILSDAKIYRPEATITTMVLNGSARRLEVWCATRSAGSQPLYSWDLDTFFSAGEIDGLTRRDG